MIYLDWAASSPPDPAALAEAMAVAAELYANPSSPHAAGRQASERLAGARARFAAALGAAAGEITFTSGGTEANTSLLLSLLDRHRLGGAERQKIRLVTTAIEHASVFEQAQRLQGHGISCAVVSPGADGRVDPQAVADAVDGATALVSVMLVNNETGAIQDVAGITHAVRERSLQKGRHILLHTDAVQAFGKVPVSLKDLDVDAASFSAHKFGGPRGVGALYLRGGTAPGFLSTGGGQENGRRPGTENLPGICAMAAAAERRIAAASTESAGARENMAALVDGLKAMKAWILPATRTPMDTRYSPYILLAAFPPLPGEVVVRTMDAQGICIATGSACSTRKKDRTRVPESMGIPPETAKCAVRISLGHATTRSDVDAFLAACARELPPLLSIAKGRGT